MWVTFLRGWHFLQRVTFFLQRVTFFCNRCHFFATGDIFFATGVIFFATGVIFFCNGWHFFATGVIFLQRVSFFFAQVPFFFAHQCTITCFLCLLKSDQGRFRSHTWISKWNYGIPNRGIHLSQVQIQIWFLNFQLAGCCQAE